MKDHKEYLEQFEQIFPAGLWYPIKDQNKWIDETEKLKRITTQALTQRDEEWVNKFGQILFQYGEFVKSKANTTQMIEITEFAVKNLLEKLDEIEQRQRATQLVAKEDE